MQSVHSSLVAPSMRGIVTSGVGGLPSGSFQDEQHAVLFQRGPGRGAGQPGRAPGVGHLLHRPSPPQRQSWNGHAISLPLTHALREITAHVPAVAVEHVDLASNSGPLRKTTSFWPNALIACGSPSSKSLISPRQCQPRANRVGAACASMSRTSSCQTAVSCE